MSLTEKNSKHTDLEKKSTIDLLKIINDEDRKVVPAISRAINSIQKFIDQAYKRIENNGRLFYIGSGTPGRLGIVDASECLPTFGVSNLIIGIIAGGDSAIRNSKEGAEDDINKGWLDLCKYDISESDCVLGISSSGRTPYVVGALKKCQKKNIYTGLITSNINTNAEKFSDLTITTLLGPEVLTGSTRMKSGTAQKLILNMISTSLMIKIGKVKDNKMIDMKLSNSKLKERGIKFIMDELKINKNDAKKLIQKHGSVREAINNFKKNSSGGRT